MPNNQYASLHENPLISILGAYPSNRNMTNKELADLQLQLKKILGNGIDMCIDELWQRLQPLSKLCNDLSALKRRFTDAKKEFTKGTIEYRNEYDKVSAQVHEGLQILIDSLKPADLRLLKSGPLYGALEALHLDQDKASRPKFLVNCNRTEPRRMYKQSARNLRNAPLQFCMVKACPAQRPQSFVERILLEEMERFDDDPDTALYYKRDQNERLDIKVLPVDDDPEDAFDDFVREFKHLFSDYTASKSAFPKAAFVFSLHETSWAPHLPEYLERILEWKKQEAERHKSQMLFFQVLYLPGIHLLPKPDDHPVAQALQPLRDKYPGNTITIMGLNPVPRVEVESWLHSIAKDGVAHNASDVLDAFDDHVRETAPKRYQKDLYDMLDVEFLQFEVQRKAAR